ncbi:MCE family protein [bacterium]|nr:MCE family protein [bacterium]
MQKNNFEFRVGLFVFIGIVILCAMIIFFGESSFFEKGYNLKVRFHNTNGLKVDAPVRFSGVDVGRVQDIQILNDGTSVELVLWLRADVVLREDVKVYISSLGVLGEKYVEFIGGTSGSAIIKEGWSPIKGEDPVAISEIVNTGKDIAEELNRLITSLRVFVEDKEVLGDLKQSIKNTKELTQNMNKFFIDANLVLNENRVSIYKSLEKFQSSAERLDSLLGKIETGEVSIGKLISGDELYNNLNGFISDVKANPWKLLIKTKEVKPKKPKETKAKKSRRSTLTR